VELQDFHQSSGVPSSFVLGTPAHAADVPASQDSHTPELAAEFAAIGAGRGQHLELASPPPSHPLRIPAWMQRQAPPISFMGQTNPAEWSPSPGVLSCATDAYLPNPALPRQAEQRRALWYPAMVDAACEAGVPVNLFDALLTQESRYNPAAISPKGAAGIAQLMPDRARRLGVRNVWDPVENMRGGARYLRVLLDEFGRFDLALAAYNAGEARVRGTGRVPRIRETVNYVSEILVTMRDQFTRRLSSREALR
jgi:soluble lytic murein transglycosylase-like protein